jgi:hypothetical protein
VQDGTATSLPEPTLVALPTGEARSLAQRVASVRHLADGVQSAAGFSAKMTQLPGPEQVVFATLDKRQGLLGLFKDGRLLAAAPADLGAIERVDLIDLPGLPHSALVVVDRHDNLVGAFSVDEGERIFVYNGHELREVFSQPVLVEQFIHAQWENGRAPALWHLARTIGTVTLSGADLTYRVQQQQLEAPGAMQEPIPPADKFHVVSEFEQTKDYRWDPRLRRFQLLT